MGTEHSPHHDDHGTPPGEGLAIDPVCGMRVDPAEARFETELEGKRHVFCSAGCQAKFEADPERYLKPEGGCCHNPTESAKSEASARRETQGDDAIYVCPMDPEVRQQGPGSCPKCGMALEPEMPSMQTRTEYTCPMHPEIVREEPGTARFAAWRSNRAT